jgi:hypothetical protein
MLHLLRDELDRGSDDLGDRSRQQNQVGPAKRLAARIPFRHSVSKFVFNSGIAPVMAAHAGTGPEARSAASMA